MNIRNSIHDLHEEITGYRRAMHQHPQTAYEEEFASALVKKCLSDWGIPFEDGIAVTGIVATIEGETNISGRAIGLRADMDALDILEADNKPHASTSMVAAMTGIRRYCWGRRNTCPKTAISTGACI
ncbi:MAG: hypothetical protein ACPGRX_07965 [Bdellovibrionales bacterium]